MRVSEIVGKRGKSRENLIQILHDIQDASGDNSLHRDAIEELAKEMELTVADIVGTASFYTMFSLTPRGKHIIRVCESPPCYIMGSENIVQALEEKLEIKMGETTADKMFTLEPTSCLGVCGVAPAMMINDEVFGNLTNQKVSEIIDKIRATGSIS